MASLGTAELPVGTNIVHAAYLGDGNYLVSSNSLAEVVAINVEAPRTLAIQNNGNGTVTVTFAGTPGAVYVVRACTNLASPEWGNVPTNMAGEDRRWIVTESKAGYSARFYRSAKP